MAFSKVKGMIYIVIFLLLLTCIWKVLDEFSVLKNICGMAVARNGNGSISPFVNDSNFCRKLQCSQIVEFFLSIIYMLVWKKLPIILDNQLRIVILDLIQKHTVLRSSDPWTIEPLVFLGGYQLYQPFYYDSTEGCLKLSCTFTQQLWCSIWHLYDLVGYLLLRWLSVRWHCYAIN